MKFSRSSQEEVTINLTPLIDIVFLLLIFFMLGARFANPVFELELPEAQSGSTAAPFDAALAVDARGALFLNQQPVSREDLVVGLRAIVQADADAAVVLRSDAGARFASVVQALDAAEQAGVRNLSIEHTREHTRAGTR